MHQIVGNILDDFDQCALSSGPWLQVHPTVRADSQQLTDVMIIHRPGSKPPVEFRRAQKENILCKIPASIGIANGVYQVLVGVDAKNFRTRFL